jgi:hypothetical protein
MEANTGFTQHHLALRTDPDVRRPHVAVHQTLCVRVVECRSHHRRDLADLRRG